MNILFVKSGRIGSRIIRWGTGEPASHVAIEFAHLGIIYHAYETGINRVQASDFDKMYEVADRIMLPINIERDNQCEKLFQVSSTYQKYDYPALVYAGLRVAMKRFLFVPMPKTNVLNTFDWDICTELVYMAAEAYAQIYGRMILPEECDLAMMTPWELRNQLREKLRVMQMLINK